MKLKFILISVLFLGLFSAGYYTFKNTANMNCLVGRGCCSSHQGVCGCSNGRAQCCDGTLSPSCRCFKDDVKGIGDVNL